MHLAPRGLPQGATLICDADCRHCCCPVSSTALSRPAQTENQLAAAPPPASAGWVTPAFPFPTPTSLLPPAHSWFCPPVPRLRGLKLGLCDLKGPPPALNERKGDTCLNCLAQGWPGTSRNPAKDSFCDRMSSFQTPVLKKKILYWPKSTQNLYFSSWICRLDTVGR